MGPPAGVGPLTTKSKYSCTFYDAALSYNSNAFTPDIRDSGDGVHVLKMRFETFRRFLVATLGVTWQLEDQSKSESSDISPFERLPHIQRRLSIASIVKAVELAQETTLATKRTALGSSCEHHRE